MRILYVGSSGKSSTARFYAKGFTDLGHEVFHFDPDFFNASSPVERLIIRAKRSPLLKNIRHANAHLCQQAKHFRPHLVFIVGENYFTHETLQTLHRGSARLIYHSHDNLFASGILKSEAFLSTLSHFDFVFTTKSQNVKRYRLLGQKNSFFIPSAYEPSIHRPHSAPKDWEYVFVGTYAASRTPYLDTLNWENLKVIGNAWDRYGGFLQKQQYISPQSIYEESYAQAISRSKVALGLLRQEAKDLHTQRTFEIPACATAQLSPRNAEVLEFFEEDKEIVCYDTVEEFKDKAHFLIQNESFQKRIAQGGYERVLKSKHTYRDRCKTILDKAVVW